MLNWVLIIVMCSAAGSGITSVRVTSKESCEAIVKELPPLFGRKYVTACVEDKQ